MLCTVALGLIPIESMVVSLLEDDRFLLRAKELWADMRMETLYVSQLDLEIFKEMVTVTSLATTGEELRHDVLRTAHISCGYVFLESFWELHNGPLRMTQNDIVANATALRAKEAPPTLREERKMWHALNSGLPEPQLVRASTLLRDASCSTALCEKGHGVGVGVMKRHCAISTDCCVGHAICS